MLDHFFVASNGDLYDTRDPQWAARPLREHYKYTFGEIDTVQQFKATLRNGPYAWPGGYPLFLICEDGGALCFACGRREARSIMDSIQRRARDGWRVVACDVNWEGPDLYCDNCSETIESAYGDPDEDIRTQYQKEAHNMGRTND